MLLIYNYEYVLIDIWMKIKKWHKNSDKELIDYFFSRIKSLCKVTLVPLYYYLSIIFYIILKKVQVINTGNILFWDIFFLFFSDYFKDVEPKHYLRRRIWYAIIRICRPVKTCFAKISTSVIWNNITMDKKR